MSLSMPEYTVESKTHPVALVYGYALY
ncbi:hypothetical protein MY4824_001878 [Beauveria thailandica]